MKPFEDMTVSWLSWDITKYTTCTVFKHGYLRDKIFCSKPQMKLKSRKWSCHYLLLAVNSFLLEPLAQRNEQTLPTMPSLNEVIIITTRHYYQNNWTDHFFNVRLKNICTIIQSWRLKLKKKWNSTFGSDEWICYDYNKLFKWPYLCVLIIYAWSFLGTFLSVNKNVDSNGVVLSGTVCWNHLSGNLKKLKRELRHVAAVHCLVPCPGRFDFFCWKAFLT